MEDSLILPAQDDAGQVFKQVASAFDAPAYARRARRVEEAFVLIQERCQRQRDKELEMVRLRLATLAAQAGAWESLRGLVADETQVSLLRGLHEDLQPRLRAPVEKTHSARTLKASLGELIASLERFNTRWKRFLESVDRTEVNREREGYNRYYVLEKECAVRLPRVARAGFVPLEPLTLVDLERLYPLLPVPALAR